MYVDAILCEVTFVTYNNQDHDPAAEPTGRARGGRARAARMSPEERSEAARRAAAARHEAVPEAVCGSPDRPLCIGDAEIECYVLDDGRRVVTQGSFLKALGRSRTVRTTGDVPPIMQGKALQPYISEDMLERARAIPFRTPRGVRAHGFNAELLPDVCEAFLQARADKTLPSNQAGIAHQAEILMRGLARVGIIALVDEATGYQDVRTRDALAKILDEFVAKELQPYLVTFPPEFYKEMFRLRGVAPSESEANKRPQYFGKLTNDIVYSRLAPGVLEELKRNQERGVSGRPKHKLFQRLTTNTGYPKLREHLGSVVTLMRLSRDWEEFKQHLDRLHPKWASDIPIEGLDVARSGSRPSRLDRV
jgi:hypothetical protein